MWCLDSLSIARYSEKIIKAQVSNSCSHYLNLNDSIVLPHLLGREFGVSPCTLPLPSLTLKVRKHSETISSNLHWLRVQGDQQTKVLSHSVQEEPRHPEVVTHLNTFTGPHLELPLGRHDLGVTAGEVDPGVETGAVVSLHHLSAVDLVGPHAAVVWTLRPREAFLGPAVRVIVSVQQGELLADAEPRLLLSGLVHHFVAGVSAQWNIHFLRC